MTETVLGPAVFVIVDALRVDSIFEPSDCVLNKSGLTR